MADVSVPPSTEVRVHQILVAVGWPRTRRDLRSFETVLCRLLEREGDDG